MMLSYVFVSVSDFLDKLQNIISWMKKSLEKCIKIWVPDDRMIYVLFSTTSRGRYVKIFN